MTLEFIDDRPPATPQAIAEVAGRLGASLPADVEAFLSQRDGGRPRPHRHPRFPAVGLTAVLGTGDGDSSIVRQHAGHEGRVGDDYVPIADAEGGNLVCVQVRGDDVGSAWFWDHELEAAAFLADLEAPPDVEPGEPTQVRTAWIDPDFLAQITKEGG